MPMSYGPTVIHRPYRDIRKGASPSLIHMYTTFVTLAQVDPFESGPEFCLAPEMM